MAESVTPELAVVEQAQRAPLPQARINPSVPRPLGDYVMHEVNAAHTLLEKTKQPGILHNFDAEAAVATRFLTFSRIHEQLSQPHPTYQELATVLQTEIEQHTANITRYQTEMRGKLPGDEKFMSLQARILTASTIKTQFTDQGEQAFMEQLRQEWKAEQATTERGRTLTTIAQTHAERARLEQLQQLLPQPAGAVATGT